MTDQSSKCLDVETTVAGGKSDASGKGNDFKSKSAHRSESSRFQKQCQLNSSEMSRHRIGTVIGAECAAGEGVAFVPNSCRNNCLASDPHSVDFDAPNSSFTSVSANVCDLVLAVGVPVENSANPASLDSVTIWFPIIYRLLCETSF